jgi:hypothetical protein
MVDLVVVDGGLLQVKAYRKIIIRLFCYDCSSIVRE